MIVTMLAVVALLAPLPFVLLDVTLSPLTTAQPPAPVEAFESAAGCPVVPGRSS